jgi:hypothetical protein
MRPPFWLVRLAGVPILTALAATWRVDVRHPQRWHAMRAAAGPRLMLLWHDALLPLLLTHRHQGITIVVSRARDGRYLRDLATTLGFGSIAGSSHRGRVGAMRGTVRAFEEGALVAVTPDGPTGPPRVIKPGALQALQQAGGMVATVHAEARPARRLASWDRFLVPMPGARVRIAFGEAFRVNPGPEGITEAVARAAHDLAALEEEIRWHDAAERTT